MKMHPENSLPLIHSVELANLLSFGDQLKSMNLHALNVLIGTNGSGKSNFIDAIELLRATASDLQKVISRGGGIDEWKWKGGNEAKIALWFAVNYGKEGEAIDHIFHFSEDNHRVKIDFEEVQLNNGVLNEQEIAVYQYVNNKENQAYIRSLYLLGNGFGLTPGNNTNVKNDSSVLSQIRDPEKYPQLAFLTDTYKQIRIYREWSFGRNTIFRQPQRADMRNDWLEEDFSNFGLFINKLRKNSKTKKAVLEGLNSLYSGITDFDVLVEGGTVQIFFHEGDFSIPATRLSDGTLRYLALLAILNDPTPPPLICIEEPELGLHPDVLPKLADLLKEASTRTQLIVTTHSDILIDALSDTPESVVVCEKHNGQTTMKRLEADQLKDWLSEYRLGNLWLRGELGGTRW